jgi:hypothetical protein
MTSPPSQPGRKRNPIADALERSKSAYDEDDFKRRLSDEYKILQDKIDKIGAFRFTVKGWSITAVIAAAAAASGKSLPTVCIISVGLVLMLVFFFLLEQEQVRWSGIFGNRAGRLEDVFTKIRYGKGAEIHGAFPVPYTAHELVLSGHRKKSRPQSPHPQKASEILAAKWSEYKQAHVGFYFVLIMLALSLLLPHYHEIGTYWRELKECVWHILPNFH